MSNKILHIEATNDTPMVDVSDSGNKLQIHIKGVSMPESTLEFYVPLFEKLNDILKKNAPTMLMLELEYMNSMSNKQIMKLIDLVRNSSSDIKVTWKYSKNDGLMKLKGEEIRNVMKNVPVEVAED